MFYTVKTCLGNLIMSYHSPASSRSLRTTHSQRRFLIFSLFFYLFWRVVRIEDTHMHTFQMKRKSSDTW
ncbi:hypothetical protein AQUCO_06100093v1 [Aquilegia coerulea]|uniref:Uncharacterized protein n=1 Tax=Aquilegia coerulea TaxID=218851 RepID=A0A2G5CDH5_AQUCA|nr:hypothetical protein AQUCO_06100093v1 [Aquilegia coerulea]